MPIFFQLTQQDRDVTFLPDKIIPNDNIMTL